MSHLIKEFTVINLRDYEDDFPDMTGGQVNLFHCKTGRNNDRFYIKRNEDGSLIGYCHHCCEHGFLPPHKDIFGLETKVDTKVSSDSCAVAAEEASLKPVGLIDGDLVYSVDPENFKRLLQLYQDVPSNLSKLGFGYIPHSDEVFLPYYTNGVLTTWQSRKLGSILGDRDVGGPKYVSHTSDMYDNDLLVHDPMCHDNVKLDKTSVLYLVEDWFSASWIANWSPALSLRGCHINYLQIEYVVSMFDHIVVWLDNDTSVVRNHAKKIADRVGLFSKVFLESSDERDPKSYHSGDMRLAIKSHYHKFGLQLSDYLITEAEV
jgi:hypothetical protein